MRLAGACAWRRCSDDRKRDITVSGGEKAATPRDMTAIDIIDGVSFHQMRSSIASAAEVLADTAEHAWGQT